MTMEASVTRSVASRVAPALQEDHRGESLVFSWDLFYKEECAYLVDEYLSGLRDDAGELIAYARKTIGERRITVLLSETDRAIDENKGNRLSRAYQLRGCLYDAMGLRILALESFRAASRKNR